MISSTRSYSFYTPQPLSSASSMVHSSCYKLSMSILNRAEEDLVVIPIEKLGMLAVISENKILFAQQSSGSEQTVMPVKIGWKFLVAEDRDSNSQHLPMKTSFYSENLEELQQRLTGEFYKALMLADEKFRTTVIPAQDITLTAQQ
ncbi:MAG: hypothetical protein P8Y20_05710 [Gammaproteobacteria bacterium]|jgi:hypothetical protein